MNFGNLFVVATPIGNLSDMSPRAIDTLKQCKIIACEDTRVSLNLLNKFEIKAQLIPYHDQNESQQTSALVRKLLSGEDIALICDAGTPAISDPGFRIVRACKKNGIDVIPIPGSNAAVAALSASGLPTHSFIFLGFPGHKESARIKLLTTYQKIPVTLIFYESCYRIEKFLNNTLQIMGPQRVIALCKELTKMHETIITDSILDVLKKLKNIPLKGEFVVLIAPEGFQL